METQYLSNFDAVPHLHLAVFFEEIFLIAGTHTRHEQQRQQQFQ